MINVYLDNNISFRMLKDDLMSTNKLTWISRIFVCSIYICKRKTNRIYVSKHSTPNLIYIVVFQRFLVFRLDSIINISRKCRIPVRRLMVRWTSYPVYGTAWMQQAFLLQTPFTKVMKKTLVFGIEYHEM